MAGAQVVGAGDLFAGRFLGPILVPAGLHQTQQGVVGEARAPDVTAHVVGLLGRGVDRKTVGLRDARHRAAFELGCNHGFSIGPRCDIGLAPSPTQFAGGAAIYTELNSWTIEANVETPNSAKLATEKVESHP